MPWDPEPYVGPRSVGVERWAARGDNVHSSDLSAFSGIREYSLSKSWRPVVSAAFAPTCMEASWEFGDFDAHFFRWCSVFEGLMRSPFSALFPGIAFSCAAVCCHLPTKLPISVHADKPSFPLSSRPIANWTHHHATSAAAKCGGPSGSQVPDPGSGRCLSIDPRK